MPATVKNQQVVDDEAVTEHTDDGNAVVSMIVIAPPDAVWSVPGDGWLCATWVVGASRIREVDLGWPQVGSRIHHSVGLWPALIDDTTHVLACREGTELVLTAGARPAGEAEVRITLTAERANHTNVSVAEDATSGPGRLIPRPLRQALIGPRNVETLRRLACWPRAGTGIVWRVAESSARLRTNSAVRSLLRRQQPRPRRSVHPATHGARSSLRP